MRLEEIVAYFKTRFKLFVWKDEKNHAPRQKE